MRHMIEDRHWPTDGEWKESVLRTVIRRVAPLNYSVGRGFVVNGTGCSKQLDILIHDNAHPVLYRDGDLVFVAPGACRAAIEVKSKVDAAKFRRATSELSATANFIRRGRGGTRAFIGLFSYEAPSLTPVTALAALDTAAMGSGYRVIDHVALGDSKFIKWWSTTPETPRRIHNSWHAYDLPQMSAGYFIHNLLMHLSPDAEQEDEGMWFPEQSKEARLVEARRRSDEVGKSVA